MTTITAVIRAAARKLLCFSLQSTVASEADPQIENGMQVRSCVPTFARLTEVSVDGRRITGILSPIYDTIIDLLRRQSVNVSLNAADALGDPASRHPEGCLGRLISNESDTISVIAKLPAAATGIRYAYVATTSTTTIVSTYDSDIKEALTDVTEVFYAFSADVYAVVMMLLVLAWLLAFSSLLVTRRRLSQTGCRQCLRTSWKVMLGTSGKQFSSFGYRSRTWRWRACLMICFCLCSTVYFFFASMIKTEKVVLKRPDTVSTYEEVLRSAHVRPVWAKQFSDYQDFESAPKDSEKGRIWQRALHLGLPDSIIPVDFEWTRAVAIDIARHRSVFIGPGYLLPMFVSNVCSMSRQTGFFLHVNAWMKQDPSDCESLLGYLRSAVTSPQVTLVIHRATQSMLEHSLVRQSIKRMHFIMSPDPGTKRQEDCTSNVIVYPDREPSHPNARHYRRLFQVTSSMLTVAGALLILEYFCCCLLLQTKS